MELALSELCGGRKVDVRTAEDLIPYLKQEVLDRVEVQNSQSGCNTVAPHDRSSAKGHAARAELSTK